ncbi:putative isochorismatase hydrolase [Mycobacterium xenopi 4042]|uniref:Putative isochorismatase hydrolase n=1 Tax=Mycobacterium xenopi 4042 TaxID=1299334 RepID=X7ZVI1_MYCXE|nr:putative isochorismatase hydrolase [Mycobacterium xenopi 4042]
MTQLGRLLDAARGAGIRVVHATYEGSLGGQQVGTARLWRALGRPPPTGHPEAKPRRFFPNCWRLQI